MFGNCCGCSKKEEQDQEKPNLTNENVTHSDINVINPDNVEPNSNVDIKELPISDKEEKETEDHIEPEERSSSAKDNTPSIVVEQPRTTSELKRQSTISDPRVEDYENDDEVFCEGLGPPMKLADNLGTPYPSKRDQSHVPLPRWFSEEDEQEVGGTQEPPATPVGRDELALRRHRFFSELLSAARGATEHRVRFDPLGPVIAGAFESECNHSFSELESLVSRLEVVTERLESICAPVQETVEQNCISSIQPIEVNSPLPLKEELPNMSVAAFQNVLQGPFATYLVASQKIGGDVATHCALVERAFQAQLQYLLLASQSKAPATQSEQMALLLPTSQHISAIQDFREKHRTSPYFNHLSAISESIPALGWVTVVCSPFIASYLLVRPAVRQTVSSWMGDPSAMYLPKMATLPHLGHHTSIIHSVARCDRHLDTERYERKKIIPAPGPYVKEMNDAGQFYTNRVLKDWKEKDKQHVEWVKAWVQTLTDLQMFVKQYHTTGLVWAGKNAPSAGAPPPPPGCPPPPPTLLGDIGGGDAGKDRSALFAQINQGENITRSLKKVTADMQTHKNPTLRTGPAPFKAPQSSNTFGPVGGSAPIDKPPVFTRDGKKWIIEYHKGNHSLVVENAEMNNVVYLFKCTDSTVVVKGKINSITLDSCKKTSIVCDSLVSALEFINCQSVQMQVFGKVPTISVDKTDGCQMYLSPESLDVEIISSKSSEMNVLVPKPNGDYTEYPVPEQYKTTVTLAGLNTIAVESKG